MSFPVCEAVSVQVPTVTIVTLSPDTVQIPVSDEARVTVSDDVELGDNVKAVADHERSVGSAKVIVCGALVTVTVWVAVSSDPDW